MSGPFYIGKYHSAFPFRPYALQVHAVDALRAFLSEEEGWEESVEHRQKDDAICYFFASSKEEVEKRMDIPLHDIPHGSVKEMERVDNICTTSSGASSLLFTPFLSPLRLAILESPTGTGKSHMLLSAAFSHLFTTTAPAASACGVVPSVPQDRVTASALPSTSKQATAVPTVAHGGEANPVSVAYHPSGRTDYPMWLRRDGLSTSHHEAEVTAVLQALPSHGSSDADTSLGCASPPPLTLQEAVKRIQRHQPLSSTSSHASSSSAAAVANGPQPPSCTAASAPLVEKEGCTIGVADDSDDALRAALRQARKQRRRKERKHRKELDFLFKLATARTSAVQMPNARQNAHEGKAEEEEDGAFLMEQDTFALLQQMRRYKHGRASSSALSPCQRPADGGANWEMLEDVSSSLPSMGGFCTAREDSSSSSSRSSSCTTRIGEPLGDPKKEEDEEEDHRGEKWMDLAKEVPLRRPKIFLASRTHAQLEQMRHDICHTTFAQHPVQYRLSSPSSSSSSFSTPHRLSVIHIASRAQLCIHETRKARVQNLSSSATNASSSSCWLNEACLEAIRYESSREGRKARRECNRRCRQGTTVVMETPRSFGPSPMGSLLDIEDHPSLPCDASRFVAPLEKDTHASSSASARTSKKEEEGQGCPYAIPSRLHALIRHLLDSSPTSASPSLSSTTSSCVLAPSLEDLVAAGHAMGACPFLASRILLRGADVVLLPYTYLVEEEQRQQLLGGSSTNPVTEKEEEETLALHLAFRQASSSAWRSTQPLEDAACRSDNPSLPSVASSPAAYSSSFASPSSPATRLFPTEAPPDCRGDLLLVDEAHHLTEQCLQTSTAHVTVGTLQLVAAVLQYYLARYAARLLTQNKQRLREILFLVTRVERYVRQHSPVRDTVRHFGSSLSPRSPPSSSSSLPGKAVEEEEEEWECSFHDFVFDAGVDHMDAHVLLCFLRESRLRSKMIGLFSMVIEQHHQSILRVRKAEKQKNVLRTPRRNTTPIPRQRTQDACGEAKESAGPSPSVSAAPLLSDTPRSLEDARQHLLRTVLELLAVPSEEEGNKNAHERPVVEEHPRSPPAAFSSASASFLEKEKVWDRSVTQRMMASAWEQFYSFLKWFQYSGNHTTVLVSRGGPASTPLSEAVSPVLRSASIRLLQLEPGTHTLMPLMRDMHRTILAGGTMRPLPLTLYPLIPAAYRFSVAHTPTASSVVHPSPASPSSSSIVMGRGGWQIISEPHVVPPSSLQVWGLGVGPSGQPWNFSHLSLFAAEKMASSSSTTTAPPSPTVPYRTSAQQVLADLAAALLNFARVLPPEGMICFVPSYRFQRRLLHFLREEQPEAEGNASTVPSEEEAEHTDRGSWWTSADAKRPFESYAQCIEKVKKIFSEVILEEHVSHREEDSVRPARRRKGDLCCPSPAVRAAAGQPGLVSSFSSSWKSEKKDGVKGESAIPKRSAEVLLRAYKEWIENPTPVIPEGTRSSPKTAEKRTRGALLFAVIGGKLSEGLNFADHLGRAVIVVGLPYANPTEKSTRSFLSHIAMATPSSRPHFPSHHASRSTTSSSSSSSSSSASLSSSLFRLYTDLCMRQVNQSVGRCIRHREDYAVAILLDARYAADAQRNSSQHNRLLQNGLSPWMHPSIHTARNFGECFRGVRQFFLERKQK